LADYFTDGPNMGFIYMAEREKFQQVLEVKNTKLLF
jgi:hypothetical protein